MAQSDGFDLLLVLVAIMMTPSSFDDGVRMADDDDVG